MSNLHSQQTGTQLHKPEKHSDAPQNSLLTKTKDNTVGYVEGFYSYSTVITPITDIGGATNNKYFSIYCKQLSKRYAVWYNVDGTGSFTLPDGYDGLIEVNITAGELVRGIIDNTVVALNTISSGGNYVLYDSATDNTTDLTLVQTNTNVVIDGNTAWAFDTTTTDSVVDKYLVSKGTTGKLQFETLSSHTPEGTAIVSTGELATKFLRADGDGTCSWGIPVDTVGVAGIQFTSDFGSTVSADGNVTVNILGGTGISTAAGVGGVTISESVEKKSKADVETLLGTTATNLGEFTGGTITDDSSIKTALQELETKIETVSHHQLSVRYSASNLDGTGDVSGTNDAWAFTETNNNAHNKFFTHVDTSAMNFQSAIRTTIEVGINGVSTKLVGGSIISSGESGNTHKITIWKADLDSSTSDAGDDNACPMVLMGTFTITGTGNPHTEADSIVLGSTAECTFTEGDGVLILMEDIETYNDMDSRGTVTLRFEDTF